MNVDGKKSDMRETTVKTVPTAKPGSCFQLEEVGSVWVKPWWLHNVLNGEIPKNGHQFDNHSHSKRFVPGVSLVS